MRVRVQDACLEYKDGLWPHAVDVVMGLIEEYLAVEEIFAAKPDDQTITTILWLQNEKKMDP
eukprot:6732488-Pyramimonas_sp.AAC.1